MTGTVTGVEEVRRTLEHMARSGAPRAATKAIRAATTPLVSALRAAVTASSAPDAVKREGRKTIGRRSVRARDYAGVKVVKLGFGVGKQTAAQRRKAEKRKAARRAAAKPGQGITKANIHWVILGTRERAHRGGHRTGRMPPYFRGLLGRAIASSAGASMAAARKAFQAAIAAESKG
jgi:hypothetical protein